MNSQVLYVAPSTSKRTRKISVREAGRRAKVQLSPLAYTHWHLEVRSKRGRLRYSDPGWRRNLTTDTATGYTNRRDWQSKLMGGGPNMFFGATASGSATATGATSLTNASASFPTAGQALAGSIVAAGPNTSGAGSIAWGVIVSNTATVLTIDQWYNPGTGAAATTPNATATYQILPGQFAAPYLAVTTDSVAPAASDTTLASELTTNGFTRALGTYAHTAAASTFTLTHTWTASGTDTINKEAVFGAVNTTGGGVMPFESAEPNAPTLVSGDTLQNTVTITIG